MQKLINRIKKSTAWVGSLLHKHWKSMAYYGCVVIVLCAVAYAAEVYRTDNPVEDMILPAAEIAAKPQEERPVLILPEGMKMLRGFSQDPQWNADLEQWESHEGVDYSISGNEVRALADGIVSSVGTSGRGNYIEVAHGKMLLRYASVSAREGLKAGDRVKAGEIIGCADESMVSEAYLGPHVHLKAIYNEALADAGSFMLNGRAQADS